MAKVVPLRARQHRHAIAPGLLFEQAWAIYPESGRRRSSRRLSAPEWARAACDCGEEELLSAVRKYVAEDKDYKKEFGAPGFHRWLSLARWESWLSEVAAPVAQRQFADAKVRGSFFAAFHAEKARKWFDLSVLEGDTLVVPYSPREEWVKGPFAQWALAHGICGWRLG